MGKYLEMAKQAPIRPAEEQPEILPVSDNAVAYSIDDQTQSLQRLQAQHRWAAFRITSSVYGDIWIALTKEDAHGLMEAGELLVYEASHLIQLSTEEIRKMHDGFPVGTFRRFRQGGKEHR